MVSRATEVGWAKGGGRTVAVIELVVELLVGRERRRRRGEVGGAGEDGRVSFPGWT